MVAIGGNDVLGRVELLSSHVVAGASQVARFSLMRVLATVGHIPRYVFLPRPSYYTILIS